MVLSLRESVVYTNTAVCVHTIDMDKASLDAISHEKVGSSTPLGTSEGGTSKSVTGKKRKAPQRSVESKAKAAAKRSQATHNFHLVAQLREAKIIGKDAEDWEMFKEGDEKEREQKQLASVIAEYLDQLQKDDNDIDERTKAVREDWEKAFKEEIQVCKEYCDIRDEYRLMHAHAKEALEAAEEAKAAFTKAKNHMQDMQIRMLNAEVAFLEEKGKYTDSLQESTLSYKKLVDGQCADYEKACKEWQAELKSSMQRERKLQQDFDRNRRRRDKGVVYRCCDCDRDITDMK